jgi:hypothetical protein
MEASDIPEIPQDGLTDELADKYNGSKVKLAKFIPALNGGFIHEDKTSWKDGKKLPDGQFEITQVVFVETEPYGKDNNGNPLMVKLKIPLKKNKVDGKWGYPTSDGSTASKLKKMLKINKVDQCIGKEVILVKTVSKKGRPYLVISIPDYSIIIFINLLIHFLLF